MKALNYTRLSAANPTVYATAINREGQKLKFVEHPALGQDYPVIVMCDEMQVAACTDFFDCSDFYAGSDYMPVYLFGEFHCAFEVE